MTMTMRLAIVSVIVASLTAATGGFSDPPTPRDDINNGKNKGGKVMEWLVRYEPTETVGSMFGLATRDPEALAIRLRIIKSGNQYFARLWRFKAADTGGYALSDKTDSVFSTPLQLQVEGKSTGRHRKAFKTFGYVSLNDASGNPTGKVVMINGIWQPGVDNNARGSDRVQLKLHVKQPLLESGGDCEDDPDTDVLEESDPPPNDDDPPPP